MKTNPMEDLQEIRKMMEGSSKFLSLSGLSGIFAGLTGLVGTFLAYLEIEHFENMYLSNQLAGTVVRAEWNLLFELSIMAVIVLVVALVFAFFFTWRKAKKENQTLISPLSFRLVRSLMVPLFFGGCFVIIAVYHGMIGLVVPATLIFYGMGLLNASKYVHVDIKYLAVSEMILGLAAFATLEYTYEGIMRMLVYWGLGFGVLHILYGTIIYFRYDAKKSNS
jgi:hypothetical protein